MAPFAYMAFNAPRTLDPSIALAAARVGALGVLDLEFSSAEEAQDSVARFCGLLGNDRGGIRLGDLTPEVAAPLLGSLQKPIGTVIVSSAGAVVLSAQLAALRRAGVAVLAQVRDGDEAAAAVSAGVDGLIARGSEGGGWIGEETTFVLLQRLTRDFDLPVWAQGGIGLHSAAACCAAGSVGAVLDSQLWLTRESALPARVRKAIARMDGSEALCLGTEISPFRGYVRPRLTVADELRALATSLEATENSRARWREAVAARVGWGDGSRNLWPLGQDACFAAPLARRYASVGGVIAAYREAVASHLRSAKRLRPLDGGSPLARSHGTPYPILQGPMTRVSDVPAFADAVGRAGALPFIALALLRRDDVQRVLGETRGLLGERPWGVGILGFVPAELRKEQLGVIRGIRPPYALIAGGRPDQAAELEREGIRTYLHVPSADLLRMFLRAGARRFVFEGRECGGHVGPRSSFVLWNTMIDVLLEELPSLENRQECHAVFAGGIHDELSAAMVAAMTAPLVERGVKVGVLLGTGYLFTHEAIETGAILQGFQDEAIHCKRTVLLESGPGHAARCAATPFAETFERERRRLAAEGRSGDEARARLEELNLGRLRIASKGLRRPEAAEEVRGEVRGRGGEPPLVEVDDAEQRAQGMYMLGQLAALREDACSVEDLHRSVTLGATARIDELPSDEFASAPPAAAARPSDVAIIGMSCILPGASDLDEYWSNILGKVDAITEIPEDRFDWRRYYDPDPSAPDKIYARSGGFIRPVAFDAARYGIPPASLTSIEPVQLLTLEAVQCALDDAGYSARSFPRDRTGVVVGIGGGMSDLGQQYSTRAALRTYLPDAGPEVYSELPEWTEDSFPGIIANVTAGRVANRFDLRGVNYAVDAACASALAALYSGVRELEQGTADMMIVAGVDTMQNPFGYLCFSKTRALSRQGRCRPFDDSADGTVISEGLAVVVLKRLADAERDGDRIYAVIKAVAGAGDGRSRTMSAPSAGGQVLALDRAYSMAGVSPATVELIECHGTGTVVGDKTEIEALTQVFGATRDARQWCAVGSVKSMIGHTKGAAGLAGVLKVVKAVYHRTLPPTIGVERPNRSARFEDSPFYVNTETRPWLSANADPRRAGVNAFGFGGTNFHAVIEEYGRRLPCEQTMPASSHWPEELFLLRARDTAELRRRAQTLAVRLESLGAAAFMDLAAEVWHDGSRLPDSGGVATLALVAATPADLREKLDLAQHALGRGESRIHDQQGVYFEEKSRDGAPKLAFLFPGQGSQAPDMMLDLAVHFAEIRSRFQRADRILADRYEKPLSSYVFPPRFGGKAELTRALELRNTRLAQPSLGAAGLGMLRLLEAVGVRPDAVAGHSYGEYVALCAAGCLPEDVLYALSEARGRAIVETGGVEGGAMAAVQAPAGAVREAIRGCEDVWIANLNSPRQTVVSGAAGGVASATERLRTAGFDVQPIPVSHAFHSPLMRAAANRFAAELARAELLSPRLPVFSNTLGAPHPGDPDAMRTVLADHLVRPVRFAHEIEAMYDDGCRIFVEVGPRAVLTRLVQETLKDRDAATIATDVAGRPGLGQFLRALGQLAAQGVPVVLDRLFAGREQIAARRPPADPRSNTTWVVSGCGVRPASGFDRPTPTRASPDRSTPASSDNAAQAARSPRHRAGKGSGRTAPPHDASGAVAPRHTALPSPDADATRAVSAAAFGGKGAPPSTGSPPSTGPASLSLAQARVMERFQSTMRRFVEVQRNTMLSLLELRRTGVSAPAGFHTRPTLALPPAPEAATALEADPGATAPALASEASGAAPRFLPEPAERPLAAGQTFHVPAGPILITEDHRGVAAALERRLAGLGAKVLRVRHGEPDESSPIRAIRLDDPDAVAHAIERIRRAVGSIAGVIHLAPLAGSPAASPSDPEARRERFGRDVKGLFHLVRATAGDLVGTPGGFVLAATALGGSFDSRGIPDLASAGHGGVAGLVKTLAIEWEATHCRVVDFEPGIDPEEASGRLLAELGDQGGDPEVGWSGERRVVPGVRPAPIGDHAPAQVELDENSVILITGGARGITSAVAEELGRRYRPTLVLVGRRPLPGATESARTAGRSTPRDLKAALIEELRAEGAIPSAAEVEARYRCLLRDREARERMNAIVATGAKVEYHALDVRDTGEFEALVAELYARHGRLDGVIHGAGIIEDKLLRDKDPASFDRVFDTKVESAFALARALRPETLRFLLLYASVAGRWGNRGQGDYAAANEVLNKLALFLDSRWPARVAALNWGPWGGSGMVSAAVARKFAERGVKLVPWEAGARACLQEIRCGRKGEGEVVLGSGPWENLRAHRAATFPLLIGADISRSGGGSFEVRRDFQLVQDLYLHDHRLRGKPVVPAAVIAEFIAESVQASSPDLHVVAVRALQVLNGVVLASDKQPVRLVAQRTPADAAAAGAEAFEVELFASERNRPSYRATVELAGEYPEVAVPPPLDPAQNPFPLARESLYTDWLFHGPTLQCIRSIQGVNREGLIGTLEVSAPSACLEHAGGGRWIFDPVLLDGGFQLALLWMRAVFDVSALPSGFGALRRLAQIEGGPVECHLMAKEGATANAAVFDVVFRNPDGRVALLVQHLEATGSRALNGLMGWRPAMRTSRPKGREPARA